MIQKEELSILVVDDLQFSCEVIKSGLKKAGFKDIRTANSANEALLTLNQKKCDVVVADFWMPEMNGLELTDVIRRWDNSNNRYTSIILLTAEDSDSSVIVAFERGVDDYLSKSASQHELAARVYGVGRTAVMQNRLQQINRRLSDQLQQQSSINLVDPETGEANRRQLVAALNNMFNHCNSRGGGAALCLIRLQVQSDIEPTIDDEINLNTLSVISNSLRLVLRPLDLVARIDHNTFAIALLYNDPATFKQSMFQRCIESIQKHTPRYTDQGKRLKLGHAIWNSHQMTPIPDATQIVDETETSIVSTGL